MAKPLWPADNSAAKIAAFGSDTLKTYTMMASAKGIDTAYLNQRMPLYWAPTLEKRLPAGTDGREWQALAQRQIALYVAQMPEPDVPKIRDNNFLVVSSRNYIDGLLTQSLAPIATITLESDTLFDFGRSDFQSLRKEGQKALNDVAARLLNMDAGKIIITGYADRLGDADANRLVSQKRAETIRTYLIGKGLPADIVEAKGAGADRPLVKCEDTLPRAQLIRCLAPNRRVEIEVRGAKG